MGEFTRETLQLALRYGITGFPSVDNPEFVSTLVFDNSKRCPNGTTAQPKSRFAYLFPSCNAALIQVRLRPDLTDSERERAIELFREAMADKRIVLNRKGNADGADLILTGVPVVVEGLTDAVRSSILVLLVAALLVMAATLAFVFRTRLRLLPLALALAAAAMTFGALSLVGGDLTMASIAVLPVLIGLAVDYSIQFQARYDEIRGSRDGPSPEAAVERAAAVGGPTIATAGLATGVGFLVAALVACADGARLRWPARAGHRHSARLRPHGGLRGAGAASRSRAGARGARTDLPPAFAGVRRFFGERADAAAPEPAVADWITTRAERALAYSLSQPAQGPRHRSRR